MKTSGTYILDGKTAIPCDDLMRWAVWFEKSQGARRVALTDTADARVSTVFLGLDHNYSESGPPLLFETMVFGGPFDQEQERYPTWEGAEEGHQRWVAKIKKEAR